MGNIKYEKRVEDLRSSLLKVDTIVCINFSNRNINDEEYWQKLDTIKKTKYYPETGYPNKIAKPVHLAIGTIEEIRDEYALVDFGNESHEILLADLISMP